MSEAVHREEGEGMTTPYLKVYPLAAEGYEPPLGSVVLAHGETGTAVQRFHRDGLWHPADDPHRLMTWTELLEWSDGPVIVVYAAPEEKS